MVAKEVDKYYEVAKELHRQTNSFRVVAERLGLTLSETIYLLKADRKSQLKKFKS